MARRPVLTQCVTTGILMGTGDILAQQGVERKGRDHDFMRTTRMASYGTGESRRPTGFELIGDKLALTSPSQK